MEVAREDRPVLHPVHLDWIKEKLREESDAEQEAVLPVVASEDPLAVQPRLSPALAEATPEADAVGPESSAADGPTLHASQKTPGAMPIALQGFGRAHLLVYGQPVESLANQRLELVLYLAHQAAHPGEEREFVDRLIISDELWPGMSREVPRQLERLRNCKSDLLDDVGKAGLSLEQYQWLETGPENALRLHAAVPSDLARFDTLVEQIAEARAGRARSAPGAAGAGRCLADSAPAAPSERVCPAISL